MSTTTTNTRALFFDPNADTISQSLGIPKERAEEIGNEYEAVLEKFLRRIGAGEKVGPRELYDAVAHIPQNMQEAFYVGQSINDTEHKLRQFKNPIAAMMGMLMGKDEG